jgi:predicted Holliday junction resolvase-like endonuclease
VTGAVDWGQLIWVVSLILAAGTIVAGFLIWVYRLVSALRAEIAEKQAEMEMALKERDSAAHLESQRAKLVEDELRRELADYKVHAAEHFATKDGVTAAVSRVEGSIKGLATQVEGAVDRLTGRIDRLLDGPGGGTSRRRSSAP